MRPIMDFFPKNWTRAQKFRTHAQMVCRVYSYRTHLKVFIEEGTKNETSNQRKRRHVTKRLLIALAQVRQQAIAWPPFDQNESVAFGRNEDQKIEKEQIGTI